MFQLRFLLGSPRRLTPHVFAHRDYRGQRTVPDPFHPEYSTFICAATPQMSSHQVMAMLLEHANQQQRGNNLICLVELHNPQTNERVHLTGDEVVLRRSDIEAAKMAAQMNAQKDDDANNPANSASKMLDDMLEAYASAEVSVVFTTEATLGDRLPCPKFLQALKDFAIKHPEAVIGEPDALENELGRSTRWNVKITKPAAQQQQEQNSEQTEQSQSEELPAPTLLERIKGAITEGNKTAVMLSNELGVSTDAIKDTVAVEGSGLINRGGWIKPA